MCDIQNVAWTRDTTDSEHVLSKKVALGWRQRFFLYWDPLNRQLLGQIPPIVTIQKKLPHSFVQFIQCPFNLCSSISIYFLYIFHYKRFLPWPSRVKLGPLNPLGALGPCLLPGARRNCALELDELDGKPGVPMISWIPFSGKYENHTRSMIVWKLFGICDL